MRVKTYSCVYCIAVNDLGICAITFHKMGDHTNYQSLVPPSPSFLFPSSLMQLWQRCKLAYPMQRILAEPNGQMHLVHSNAFCGLFSIPMLQYSSNRSECSMIFCNNITTFTAYFSLPLIIWGDYPERFKRSGAVYTLLFAPLVVAGTGTELCFEYTWCGTECIPMDGCNRI